MTNKKHNNITIFADSSVGLTSKVKDKIKLLPLYVYFDQERVYNEINGITREEFFKTLEKEQAYTSGCNPADVEELIKAEYLKGNNILVFSVSSGLSSTYNTIKIISESLMDEYGKSNKIEVIDTKSISVGMSYLIEDALELIEEGADFSFIADELNNRANKIELYFLVDDLKYMARGGRINKSTAAIGDVLNIKPILYFTKDGKIEAFTKVRGLKAGVNQLYKIINKQENKRVTIGKSFNEKLCDELSAKANINENIDLDLVICSHTGPNMVAVIIYRK